VVNLTEELRARVCKRAQTVGVHTAMLELREAVDAIGRALTPGDGRWLTEDELEDECEKAAEDAREEAHTEGYDEAVRDMANETVKVPGARWGV
jgi:hypothetical protein